MKSGQALYQGQDENPCGEYRDVSEDGGLRVGRMGSRDGSWKGLGWWHRREEEESGTVDHGRERGEVSKREIQSSGEKMYYSSQMQFHHRTDLNLGFGCCCCWGCCSPLSGGGLLPSPLRPPLRIKRGRTDATHTLSPCSCQGRDCCVCDLNVSDCEKLYSAVQVE